MIKALNRFYRIPEASGVNIKIANDGALFISSCTLIAKGDSLNIGHRIYGLNEIGQLSAHITRNSFVALNLTGKGVLTKQVPKIEIINRTNFSRILPNGNPDEFYIQNFISGDYSFISVIRKKDADGFLLQLKALEVIPLSLSLGPFPIENIIPILNLYEAQITVDRNIIERNESGEWTSIRNSTSASAAFPLKIALEKIDDQLIVAYATAFQLVLAGQILPVAADSELLKKTLLNTLSIKKIKVQSALILSAFFVLLAINLVIFSFLGNSNRRLNAELSQFAKNSVDSADQTDNIRRKEQQLENLGWENGIIKCILIDQLDALMPPALTLEAEAVDPVDPAAGRNQNTIKFEKRTIKITGSSDIISPVYEWITKIKKLHWVKLVQMESYSYNNEIKANVFIINLKY